MSRKLQVLSSTELRTYNLGLATFDQYYLCFIGIFLLEFAKIVKEPINLKRFIEFTTVQKTAFYNI